MMRMLNFWRLVVCVGHWGYDGVPRGLQVWGEGCRLCVLGWEFRRTRMHIEHGWGRKPAEMLFAIDLSVKWFVLVGFKPSSRKCNVVFT